MTVSLTPGKPQAVTFEGIPDIHGHLHVGDGCGARLDADFVATYARAVRPVRTGSGDGDTLDAALALVEHVLAHGLPTPKYVTLSNLAPHIDVQITTGEGTQQQRAQTVIEWASTIGAETVPNHRGIIQALGTITTRFGETFQTLVYTPIHADPGDLLAVAQGVLDSVRSGEAVA